MKPSKATLSALAIGLMFGSGAWALDGSLVQPGTMLLAGEILIGPDKGEVKTPGARSQRERAGAYQRGTENAVTEEEEGFLSPRGGAPTEERAYDNRSRARAFMQGADPAAALPGMPAGKGDILAPGTSQERARDLRARARTYSGSGNPQDLDLSNVGADGIPIVTCRGDVDNVAARIGEDTASGTVFYVMRNNKPVKVKCK